MNSNRRADLQRKLSMGAVPRPPADLLDRIKADIPQHLTAESERERFTGSVAFTMRIAASILMLITTAFITLRLLEPETKIARTAAPRQIVLPAAADRFERAPSRVISDAPQQQVASEEVSVEITQAAPTGGRVASPTAASRAAAPAMAMAAPPPPVAAAPGFVEEPRQQALARADANRADDERELAKKRESREQIAGMTTTDEAYAPEPEARAEASRSRDAAGLAAAPSAPSPSIVGEAHASEIAYGPRAEVFGISVDPNVFTEVRNELQEGRRPAAESIDVDALVNYFAGPPVRGPRGIALEVEASPAPVEADGDHAVLRFTIDTPRMHVAARNSTPPVASDASVEIEIDPKAVAHFRRIGGSTDVPSESTLYYNLSVTGLYQLELHPHLQATQHLATVRLRYRSITDGREHTITRVVRGKDLARDWSRASRRHRLASLGAVWSESLQDSAPRAPQGDVARRAQELSSQQPKDSRARELANAATATAAGGQR